MPEEATVQRARRKAREGKAPSTRDGEFVCEEIHHIRAGKPIGTLNTRVAASGRPARMS